MNHVNAVLIVMLCQMVWCLACLPLIAGLLHFVQPSQAHLGCIKSNSPPVKGWCMYQTLYCLVCCCCGHVCIATERLTCPLSVIVSGKARSLEVWSVCHTEPINQWSRQVLRGGEQIQLRFIHRWMCDWQVKHHLQSASVMRRHYDNFLSAWLVSYCDIWIVPFVPGVC